jgi:N-acetylmuramoyl-L-alanine amidase
MQSAGEYELKRVLVFLFLFLFSFDALCNEIARIRSTVQQEKTRIVFDLSDEPVYTLDKSVPYHVVLELKNIENTSSLPKLDRNFGRIVEKVEVSSSGQTVRYHFILKWNVSPLVGKLAPQANYTHHRIYLDFLNSRISGAPRGTDENRADKKDGDKRNNSQDVKGEQKDSGSGSVNQVSPDSRSDSSSGSDIRVLTPDEAQRKKDILHQANQQHMDEIDRAEVEKKRRAEAEAKARADADRRKAEAEAKAKADAERRRAEAEAKARADADRRKAEAKAKADAERRRAEAEAKADAYRRKAEAEAKAKARAEAEKAAAGQDKKSDDTRNGCKKRKIVIAIDAGHGGKDPGASGPSGHKEKNVTLAISRRLAKMINATSDMRAVMIRNSDIFVDLDSRSEKARKANADILISIHADAAANKSARGASVLVLNNDRAGRENQKMSNSDAKHSLLLGGASEVLEETAANGESNEYMKNMIIDLTSGKSRDSGYDLANRIITYMSRFATLHKYRPDERSLAVLKAPDIPSILVETGFISNEREEKLLTSADHQKKIANAIYQSIRDHLKDPRYRVEGCRKK